MSIGFAECGPGDPNAPDLTGYPLLVWMDGKIKTEDGQATLEEILALHKEDNSIEFLAKSFETTTEHIIQALQFAFRE
jgi:hypothetical protein